MAEKAKYYENSYGNTFGTLIATPIGRATFVHLVTPNAKYKPEKYGCHILFPKDDATVKAGLNQLIAMCKSMAAQKYGDKIPAFVYGPVRDGDEQKYQGFAGCWYIKASSKRQPEIVDAKRTGLDVNLVVPGVLVRGVVTPVLFDSGFSYQLQCVQLIKDDGVRYYGGADPKSLLNALDEEESETPEAKEEPAVVEPAVKAPEVKEKATAKAKNGKAAALDML